MYFADAQVHGDPEHVGHEQLAHERCAQSIRCWLPVHIWLLQRRQPQRRLSCVCCSRPGVSPVWWWWWCSVRRACCSLREGVHAAGEVPLLQSWL